MSDFIFASTNFRAMNFHLNLMKQYKVDHIAFGVTPNIELLSSIAASLNIIDILKYCTVSFGKLTLGGKCGTV